MADPIRIRAHAKEGTTEVHVLMPHPMETGFRKNEGGEFIAAHYITDVRIEIAGKLVLAATLSRAVSEDPLLYFRLQGGSPGDTISVSWVDTRGEHRADEAQILPG